MSIRAVRHALYESPYSGKAKLIHIAIAEVVSQDTGQGWISQSKLAKAGTCTIEYVRRTIKKMVDDGSIQVVSHHSQHHATTYRYGFLPVDNVGRSEPPAPNYERSAPNYEHVPDTAQPPTVNAQPPTEDAQPPTAFGVFRPYTQSLLPVREEPPNPLPVDNFTAFWDLAARKTGKGAARKAFTKALTKTDPKTLIESWTLANTAWQTRTDKRFIPHPSTWLNESRWDDEPPTAETRELGKVETSLIEATRLHPNPLVARQRQIERITNEHSGDRSVTDVDRRLRSGDAPGVTRGPGIEGDNVG